MLLNAETMGNLVTVIDNVAASPNLPAKVQEDQFFELWKKQNNKYTEVRDIFRPLTEEEKRQYDAINGTTGVIAPEQIQAVNDTTSNEQVSTTGEEGEVGKEMLKVDNSEPTEKVQSAEKIKHVEIKDILK